MLRRDAKHLLFAALGAIVVDILWLAFLRPSVFGLQSSFEQFLFNLALIAAPLLLLKHAWGKRFASLLKPRSGGLEASDYLTLASLVVILASGIAFSAYRAITAIFGGNIPLKRGGTANIHLSPFLFWFHEFMWFGVIAACAFVLVALPRLWTFIQNCNGRGEPQQ